MAQCSFNSRQRSVVLCIYSLFSLAGLLTSAHPSETHWIIQLLVAYRSIISTCSNICVLPDVNNHRRRHATWDLCPNITRIYSSITKRFARHLCKWLTIQEELCPFIFNKENTLKTPNSLIILLGLQAWSRQKLLVKLLLSSAENDKLGEPFLPTVLDKRNVPSNQMR